MPNRAIFYYINLNYNVHTNEVFSTLLIQINAIQLWLVKYKGILILKQPLLEQILPVTVQILPVQLLQNVKSK